MKDGRTKGWRRISIIISVLWLAGFGVYLWIWSNDDILVPYKLQLEQCSRLLNLANEGLQYGPVETRGNRQSDNFSKYRECLAKAETESLLHRPSTQTQIAWVAAIDFLSVILAWLIAWVSISLTRWVRAGFGTPQ